MYFSLYKIQSLCSCLFPNLMTSILHGFTRRLGRMTKVEGNEEHYQPRPRPKAQSPKQQLSPRSHTYLIAGTKFLPIS